MVSWAALDSQLLLDTSPDETTTECDGGGAWRSRDKPGSVRDLLKGAGAGLSLL